MNRTNRTIPLLSAMMLTLLVSGGCSSSSGAAAAKPTAKKGSTASSATAAKTSGQKVGATAKAAKTKTAKGSSVGGTGKQKGGGLRGPTAAKTAGQKASSTSKVIVNVSKATDKGATIPDTSGNVTCGADNELEAFCADDTNVTVCSGGHWYTLDCTTLDGFCGEDLASLSVDCYAAADLVVTGDVQTCDASTDGVAYCSDDDHEVYCDQGTWYEVSCSAIQAGDYCGEDDAHVIDCGQ